MSKRKKRRREQGREREGGIKGPKEREELKDQKREKNVL